MNHHYAGLLTFACLAVSMAPLWPNPARAEADVNQKSVLVLRTPNEGIQPQAVVDATGAIHLVYFKGPPAEGDVYYARQAPGEDQFARSWKVNQQTGSAIAVGTIRGAQLALGRKGRIHVAWNGSGKGLAATGNGHKTHPMLYTRMNEARDGFEPERNVMTWTGGLDGGGSVAADDQGRVWVVWHGQGDPQIHGEAHRAVYMAQSRDDGLTFEREIMINPGPSGACGCCGLKAMAEPAGAMRILFRAATEGTNRDMVLLSSPQAGSPFTATIMDRWTATQCPMSSACLVATGAGLLAGWETAGTVRFALLPSGGKSASTPGRIAGRHRGKHPVLAMNAKGEVLLAWAEDTGWAKGGTLAWQVFDQQGQPRSEIQRAPGVPSWGLPAAVALPDNRFVIIY